MSNRLFNRLSILHLNILAALICIGASYGVYQLGVVPVLAQQQSVSDDRKSLNDLQEKLNKTSKHLSDMQLVHAKLVQSIQDSSLQLKPYSHLNQHVAEVSGLAGKSGLEIQHLQPGDIVNNERYLMVPIQLTGVGNYVDVVKFLNAVHVQHPDTLVYSFRLNGTPEDESIKPRFSFQLYWHASAKKSSSSILAGENAVTE